MHNLQPCARKAHKHPHNWHISLNCWQNISNTRIYLPIVGRIYPISEYIPNFWQNISDTRIYPIPIYIYIQLFIYSPIIGSIYPIQIYEIEFAAKKISGAQFAAKGPNLPGPDLPKNGILGPKKCGAQFAAKSARGLICRGPICRGPIGLEPSATSVH